MHVIESLQRQSKEIDGDEENVDLDEETVDAEEIDLLLVKKNDVTDGLIKDKENCNHQSKEIDGDEENVDLDKETVAEENDVTDGLIKDKEICNTDSEIPKCDEIGKQSLTKSPSKPQIHKNNKRKKPDNDDTTSELTVHSDNTQNCKHGARDVPKATVCTDVQASPVGRKLKGSDPEKNDADPAIGVQTRGKKKKLVEE